tara:strand:+ start:1184 stop:2479 length:1296 start_codon:yes stop_codon:yes gene_type:complete
MQFKDSKIAIVGLGYVGLPLAVEFGKHRSVIGFDIDKDRIDQLISGVDRTLEVTVEQLQSSELLEFTDQIASLDECEIFIVTVPTPVDKLNKPDFRPLVNASKMVGEQIKKGNLVIYESTVYPGCTEEVCVPILEESSGLKYNQDFFCGYSPERVNPGDKINSLTKIKKITSGSNPEIANLVDKLYSEIIIAGTFLASSIRVAEAAKVIENSQRDLNIAFVNELSLIFNKAGIDTKEVLDAAGSKWNFLPFKPGIVGGHCIGVDPYYLTYKAEELGYHPEIILAGRRINDHMPIYAAEMLVKNMIANNIDVSKSTVGILGITFKENCPDIRNTKVIDIINELKKLNINILVEDPWADKKEVKDKYGINLTEINKSNKVDALVVAVGHKEFRSLTPLQLIAKCKGEKPVLADIKSLYDKDEAKSSGFSVFRL